MGMTEEERKQEIARAAREALWRASFPRCVWEESATGWTSREPTREDWQRRAGSSQEAGNVTNPDLEAHIAEQRKKGEQAMWQSRFCSDPRERRRLRDVAAWHYQQMAGLISMRTDERVEEMERAKGLRT